MYNITYFFWYLLSYLSWQISETAIPRPPFISFMHLPKWYLAIVLIPNKPFLGETDVEMLCIVSLHPVAICLSALCPPA